MKKLNFWLINSLLCCSFLASTLAYGEDSHANSGPSTLKIGVVNTKRCLEESKVGKEQQANFEKMKKQMESVLQDKESDLEEIESKLADDEYMDSISEEAANSLKRKKRQVRNEGMQLQQQYMQTLQRTNMEVVRNLTEEITKASAAVAGDRSSPDHYDVIFTDEACNFSSPDLDVTNKIIQKMDEMFEKSKKENDKKK